MVYIALCDDEEIITKDMHHKIELYFMERGVSCKTSVFSDGRALREAISNGERFDVLFLDIEMPGLDGLRLGQQLREQKVKSLIVFVSNHDNMVFESFKAEPFRFIRKSDFDTDIRCVVKDIIERLNNSESQKLLLKSNQAYVSVHPQKIIYVEYANRTLTLRMINKSLNLNYTLGDLEKMLQEYGFIRTHKSFLVNYRYIENISRRGIKMDTGELLPISKNRVTEVKDVFRELMTC